MTLMTQKLNYENWVLTWNKNMMLLDLWVLLQRDNLIQDLQILKILGLFNVLLSQLSCMVACQRVKFSTSDANPLVKDNNSEPASGMFSDIRVIGILLYLYGHNHQDFSFAVNYCPWYMFIPKSSNKLAQKRLVRKLKQTKDSALVLYTNSDECKVDA